MNRTGLQLLIDPNKLSGTAKEEAIAALKEAIESLDRTAESEMGQKLPRRN
ncbi:MAG: hypothetical protein WBL55_26020 [Xanthobacteraceae bacterium]